VDLNDTGQETVEQIQDAGEDAICVIPILKISSGSEMATKAIKLTGESMFWSTTQPFSIWSHFGAA
jgi:hypothetical protein